MNNTTQIQNNPSEVNIYGKLMIAPKSITNTAIMVYLLIAVASMLFYNKHIMEFRWWFFGIFSVLGFFLYANYLTKKWLNIPTSLFIKRLFSVGVTLRILWVLISYALYHMWTGTAFTISAADELIYNIASTEIAYGIRCGNWNLFELASIAMYNGGDISDHGYPIYSGLIYWMSNDSILVLRLVKALLSAWTVVLVYKVATRNFGEYVGRMAGVFCLLMPNLIYYCSFHLKETEMLFLTMLFIERADWLLRQPKLKLLPTVAVMLIPLVLFTVRTALAAILIAALFCALLLTNGRVSGFGKRVVLVIAATIFVVTMFLTSTGIGRNVSEMWQTRGSGQKANMEWRSKRSGSVSQQFAKYAGAAVFAPMIFTIPFPTMTDVPGQENQKMIHGGNFVKNIVSYFTIMALLILLVSGNWRKHVLLIAVLCGYLLVLVFSNFAHSERFHLPVLPLTLMFAALGISLMKENPWVKKYFNYWCVLMFLAAVAWNWFKLAGRGMI